MVLGMREEKSAVVLSVFDESVIHANPLEEEISVMYVVPAGFPPSVQLTMTEVSNTPVKLLAPGTTAREAVEIAALKAEFSAWVRR